jgi:hypothetical protein
MDVRNRTSHRWRIIVAALALVGAGLVGACGTDEVGEGEGSDDGGDVVEMTDTRDAADTTVDTGSDADVAPEGPKVAIEPKELSFEDVEKGKSKTAELVVRNDGDQPATLQQLELKEVGRASDGDEFSLADETPELPVEIPPKVFKTVTVAYKPTDFETDRGQLTLRFREPGVEARTVPITTVNAYPDIEGPDILRVGGVDQGSEKRRRVVLYNRGIQPLRIEAVDFNGDDGFSVAFPRKQLPVSIERNDPFEFELVFQAPDTDIARGQLAVDSNDPDQDPFEITVTANRPRPCIQLQRTAIDFGEVGDGKKTEELKMLNCSRTRTLEVTDIGFSADGNGAFSLAGDPELPLQIDPAEEGSVSLEASIERKRTATGLLVLRSNDTEQSPIFVDLRATRSE